ncbi:12998_t:CDS:1, partial [Racocetra fulgida]
QCPFCNMVFPNTLPPRIESYLATHSGSSDVINQYEFCHLHDAEFRIVQNGRQKNYPLTIDFDNLPNRVKDMFPELLNIAVGKTKSLFRDLAIDVYNTLGRGAKKPTAVMERFINFIV